MTSRPNLYIISSPPPEEPQPQTLDEIIRLIAIDSILPCRLEIPTRPITGEDIDRAIRTNIDKLVEIYLQESRFRKPS